MNEQIPLLEKLNLLANDVIEYLKLRLEYIKLSGTELLIRIISAIVLFQLLSTLFAFVYFFLSIAFTVWIAGLLEDWAAAALITAGIQLLLILFIFLRRKQLVVNPITRLVISLIKNSEDAKESR